MSHAGSTTQQSRRTRRVFRFAAGLAVTVLIAGCGSTAASPSGSASAPASAMSAAPGSPSGSPSGEASATATSTSTPSPTPTASPTPTPPPTPTPTPAFVATGSMTTPRSGHAATLLANGKVLITGGTTVTAAGVVSVTATAEIYDPATEHFTATGKMNTPRRGHQATLLNNGKVLITGGSDATHVLSTAELYDPATGTFTYTANPMSSPRTLHRQTVLLDGRVLITGGSAAGIFQPPLASVDIYNPVTDHFISAPNLKRARMDHSATLLMNGKVLIAGGWGGADGSAVINSAELFDPATGTFALTGSLHTARAGQAAVLLQDGRVLIAGGNDESDAGSGIGELASAEIYSAAAGTFAVTGSMSTPRGYFAADLLSDGNVIVIGGFSEPPYGPFDIRSYHSGTEIYSVASGHFGAGPTMHTPRRAETATVLKNGFILVAGGECYQTIGGHMGPMPWAPAELGEYIS
jgi:hypothetical protein